MVYIYKNKDVKSTPVATLLSCNLNDKRPLYVNGDNMDAISGAAAFKKLKPQMPYGLPVLYQLF